MVDSVPLMHGAYQDMDVMEHNRRVSTNAVIHKRKPIVVNTNRFIDDALYYDGTYTHTQLRVNSEWMTRLDPLAACIRQSMETGPRKVRRKRYADESDDGDDDDDDGDVDGDGGGGGSGDGDDADDDDARKANTDTTDCRSNNIRATKRMRRDNKRAIEVNRNERMVLLKEQQRSTDSSTTEQRSTDNSTTEQRSTDSSTTEQRSTDNSTTEQRSTDSSTTEQRSTDNSTTEQRSTDSSTTEQRSTDSSTTEQRSTDNSTTEQRSTDSSTTEQRSTDSSTTVQRSTDSSTTEQRNRAASSSTNSGETHEATNTNDERTQRTKELKEDMKMYVIQDMLEPNKKTTTSKSEHLVVRMRTEHPGRLRKVVTSVWKRIMLMGRRATTSPYFDMIFQNIRKSNDVLATARNVSPQYCDAQEVPIPVESRHIRRIVAPCTIFTIKMPR